MKTSLPKILLFALPMFFCVNAAETRDDDIFKKAQMSYDEFYKKSEQRYNSFRDSCNTLYANALRKAWKEYDRVSPQPRPIDDEIPPVVQPAPEPVQPQPVQPQPVQPQPVQPQPVQPKEDPQPVTPPTPQVLPTPVAPPQPQPIEPVQVPVRPLTTDVNFTFFGTPATVRMPANYDIRLRRVNYDAIADMWKKLSSQEFNVMVSDCLDLRKKHKLSDWAYLLMIEKLSQACVNDQSSQELLKAYIFAQSGYKMRLAIQNGTVEMLWASDHYIYNRAMFNIEGDHFYSNRNITGNAEICYLPFPGEQTLSLWIREPQQFATNNGPMRTISSNREKNMVASMSVNKNLIDFYNTYPTSQVNNDNLTRWAMYANTPLNADIRNNLYPQLNKVLAPLTQLQKVTYLLHWLQTGLVYALDNDVWGHDRAFFAEETLYYPTCDCEDHAILFSRLVRDLVGLNVALVYYPGHLASAVEITDPAVTGDYLLINGRKFYICDPTIKGYGADPGVTMRNMNNSQAKAIVLEKQ